ncbi:MAG: hypothetical protein GXO22_02270 [Aquificae bacterium]|nr:hypothetical protein [Aquificota bacterium]
MSIYKVFYFEDLEEEKVKIRCPVCERLKRNFIEPVAVILEEGDYQKFEGKLEKIKQDFRESQNIDALKNRLKIDKIYEEILNKDDLVCILHQNKEGEHWEEDTEEFKKWNEKVKELAFMEELTDGDIESLDKNNLVNQFWRRVRAYRFAVDYKSLWKEAGQDWESFKGKIKSKIDLEELEKNIEVLKLYLKRENWIRENNIYDFRKIKFPLFYDDQDLIKKENENWKTEINLNFWYKNEILAFQNKPYFSRAIFQKEAYFSKATFKNMAFFINTIFQNVANFSSATFQNGAVFSEATFKNVAYFSSATFQNGAVFSEATFQNEASFSWAIFQNKADFSKATFKNVAYFSWAIFQNKADFGRATFKNVAYFRETTFQNEAYFGWAIFEKEVYFRDCNMAKFVLDNINLYEETYFEINNCNFIALKFANFVNHTNNFLVLNSGIDTGLKKEFTKAKLKQFLGKYLEIKDEKLENAVNLFLEDIEKSFSDGINKVRKLIGTEDNEDKVKEEFQRLVESVNTYFAKFLFENFLTIKQLNTQPAIRELFIPKKRKEEEIIQVFKRKKEIIIDILRLITSFSYLEIDNCILNNMKFSNCDFSQADRITIKKSIIEDISFNNIDWGEITENRINPELFREDPKSARETYRQIKYVLDKQADHINANWFYALEMRAYERYLDNYLNIKGRWKVFKNYVADTLKRKVGLSKNWFKNLLERIKNNGGGCQQKESELVKDFIIFKIHKNISNFGQSWVRPLALIVLTTIFMLGFGVKVSNSSCLESSNFSSLKDVENAYYLIPFFEISFWAILTIVFIAMFAIKFLIKSISIFSLSIFMAIFLHITGHLWLYTDKNILQAIFSFLDSFAVTLNIFRIFTNFSQTDKTLYSLYPGYLFLYKIYAVFILVLVYQFILAIRRRVRR